MCVMVASSSLTVVVVLLAAALGLQRPHVEDGGGAASAWQ
jgi:hypothetical protein